ncbi:hypothetical protein [Euzebya tangerina]|uniref:hypothetical protein n=1 Tax=Euzebya tangerina TaxID=591198 RepID=UPI000E3135A7|nr:hypothetical protein [Euzebya tangerina]
MTPDGEDGLAPTDQESSRALGSRLTALQIRMETNHAQTNRLLTLVSGLSSQVATALADASSSADGIGGRMQHLARDAESMLARLLSATQTTNEAIADVALRVDRLGGATGEYSRRLRSDIEAYEVSTLGAISSLERAAATIGTSLVDDIAEVLTALRVAVTDTGADLAGIADDGQVRLQRMIDRLDQRVSDHTGLLTAATEQLGVAVADLAAARDTAADASQQMADTAANLHTMSVAALDRITESAGALEQRISEMLDAVLTAGTEQTAAEVQALSTTLAWATRSIQQVVETLTDDLASTTKASLRRIDEAGEAALERLRATVDHAEESITQEVRHSVEPLREETHRIAEQQGELARTIHDTTALLRRRADEAQAQEDAAARLDQVTRQVLSVIEEHTEGVRSEQAEALERAEAVADRLDDGAGRAEAVIGRLADVADQLHDAADAADRSRQELQALVTRAQEVSAAAAARRRTAAVVPPPT